MSSTYMDYEQEDRESDARIMEGQGLENEWARREAEELARYDAYCAEEEADEAFNARGYSEADNPSNGWRLPDMDECPF